MSLNNLVPQEHFVYFSLVWKHYVLEEWGHLMECLDLPS